MGDSFESWASIIRSCCLTSKTPLTPWEINRDTKMLEGQDIPFKKFMSPTLEDMLRKIQGLTVFSQQGKILVNVTPTKETAHISRMVQLQKPAKKKSRRSSLAYNKFSYNHRPSISRSQKNKKNVRQCNNAQYSIANQSSKLTPVKWSTTKPILSTTSHKPVTNRPAVSSSQPSQLMATTVHDPRLLLKSYAEIRKLPLPTYKYLLMDNHSIISLVVINSKKYSSYPKVAKTKEEAGMLAAQAALDDLGENKTLIKRVSDTNLVSKREEKEVNNYSNGLSESKLVKSSISHHTLDIGTNESATRSSLNQKNNKPIRSSILTEPKILKIPDVEYFWLHVYAVYNTTSIWGVIIDQNYKDKLKELEKKMKVYYDSHNSKSRLAIPGKFYAVFDQEWHRVRCIKTDKSGKTATLFLIDRGDQYTCSMSKLRLLQPEFCKLPAQSIQLSITGREIYADCSEVEQFLREILHEKDVFVKNLKFRQRSTEVDVISAQIYLLRNNEGVDVHELLISKILTNCANLLIYATADKVAQPAWITHVSEQFRFIQLYSNDIKQLNTFVMKWSKDCLPDIKIHVLKNVKNSNWYGLLMTKVENDNQDKASFIVNVNMLLTAASYILVWFFANIILMTELT